MDARQHASSSRNWDSSDTSGSTLSWSSWKLGTGQMLPPAMNVFGSYGPMRGSLMDPRNYQVFLDVKVMDVVVVLHVKGIQVRVCMDKVC